MSNTIRIKRSTATDTPTSLQNAELAYSESSDKLFIGVGTGGAGGSATTIVPIGGAGYFLTKTLAASTYQSISGMSSYLTTSTASSTYQTQAGMSSYLTTSTASTTYAPLASPTFTGTVTIPAGASISGYLTSSSASSTYAPLASPTFTGTPAAPTAAADTNTTQLATTAYVVGQGYLKSATASTTYAPLASPALTGVPTAPTAATSTNTTQVATTAFVLGQANSTAGTIAMNGTQAAGTSNLYARADHIHPSDTTRAPLASPTFTGTVTIPAGASISGYLTTSSASSTYAPLASPTFTGTPAAPTAATDTNTTQVATTAFVVGQGYLKSATASSTYQTQSGMSAYLTTSTASTTYAPLASPTFTGVPAVPTATAGTNTTQAASTAFVQTAVANLVASAPAALDTLNELPAALGNDASFSTTITTSIGTKLAKSSNLSDLADAATARTNLGLGTMAVQSASSVAITGGTIDGVTIDGGTF